VSIALALKNGLTNLPRPVGQALAYVPFGLRPGLGKVYRDRRNDIAWTETASRSDMEQFIFDRVSKLACFAHSRVPFYGNFYESHNFDPASLKRYDDLKRIPIVRKKDLQDSPLEDRSSSIRPRTKENTGGSTGQPLSLYVQPDAMAHEWAHIHEIWNSVSFRQYHLKMTMGGRLSSEQPLTYDAVRHSYHLNTYQDLSKVTEALATLLKTAPIRYLHGYPSSIYDFAEFCNLPENADIREQLRRNIQGVMLGSEFPKPTWRECIETTFEAPSVSWYGHTERAVLAGERDEPYLYHPFPSYGFAEACPSQETGETNLVATSYYNFASPMIRYDTEDVIEATEEVGGRLKAFRVTGGRQGEFIQDLSGKRISLTGLIYGRHHLLFDHCSHIQVQQDEVGSARILYVPKQRDLTSDEAKNLFSSDGVNIDFSFEPRDQPVRTSSGKVMLLVKA